MTAHLTEERYLSSLDIGLDPARLDLKGGVGVGPIGELPESFLDQDLGEDGVALSQHRSLTRSPDPDCQPFGQGGPDLRLSMITREPEYRSSR